MESYRWASAEYNEIERFVDIGREVVRFALLLGLDQLSWTYGVLRLPSPEALQVRRRSRAEGLYWALLRLGPTFIKVGQFFSTRADLLPVEYLEALARLQDQVPAFSFEQVEEIIQRELDHPRGMIFPEIDPVPLASASIGQVHRARLQSGEEVVVKVQRPGLKQLFEIDLGILERLAAWLQQAGPGGSDRHDWLGILAECRRTLLLEIDYLNEGRNADTFRRQVRRTPKVRVPRIHWRYCSPSVLTMEYVPGIKITDIAALEAAGLSPAAVVNLGAQCYLRQLLRYGFFHADPHPGNFAVGLDGTLIFYDFGMMGRLPEGTNEKLIKTFSGIVQRDARLVVESMVELGALASKSDLGPVRRSVQFMLENYLSQSLESHQEISMVAINDDLYALNQDQPFRFPASFTFVLRSLVALESLGKLMDPEFNLMTVAEPLAGELMPSGGWSWTDPMLRRMEQFANTNLQLPAQLEQVLTALDQGELVVRVQDEGLEAGLVELGDRHQGRMFWVLAILLMLAGVQCYVASFPGWGTGFMAVVALIGIVGLGMKRKPTS